MRLRLRLRARVRLRVGVPVAHLDNDLLVPQLALQLRLAELASEHQPPLLPLELDAVLDAVRRVRRAEQMPAHAHLVGVRVSVRVRVNS